MINPNLPLELDDGRQVTLSSFFDGGGFTVWVDGPIVRPDYTADDAEDDGLNRDSFEEFAAHEGRDTWWYGLDGVFDGGNAEGFFILRNRYDDIPDVFEDYFV